MASVKKRHCIRSYKEFSSEYPYIKRKDNKFILIEKKMKNQKLIHQIYKQ
jgi:hypothetical protein